MQPDSQRFDRQVRFSPLGRDGQARLQDSRVLLVGCGALGGVLAQTMARAGVGELVLVDRDVVEESNLPRQVLFEDRHAKEGTLKVLAAEETLLRVGGPTRFETHAQHVDADTLDDLADGCDLVLDGTDNLGTRYLINDWCVENDVPWIYGGVVGSGGLVLGVIPGKGPCLRCLFDSPPPTGTLETCDSAGVILPAVGAIASLQAGVALRLLAESEAERGDWLPALMELDVWSGSLRRLPLARQDNCNCCGKREFSWLHAPQARRATVLCGRNAVQVRGLGGAPDLDQVAERLGGMATDIRRAGPLLRCQIDGRVLTLFEDGRALIEGVDDTDLAIAFYDRYVGS